MMEADQNRADVYIREMRFHDHGLDNKHTDVFRFWYLTDQDFRDKILSQTLVPYLEAQQ